MLEGGHANSAGHSGSGPIRILASSRSRGRGPRRSPSGPGSGLWLAQRSERRPDLGREQLGFFPGGEVTAPGGLVEVAEGGVAQLDPAARGPEDLAGERGEADRELDRRGSLP